MTGEPLTTEDEVESVAYDTKDSPYLGYSVRASYLKPPQDQNALIEVSKDGVVVRSFKYPAYRIYNIAAHFQEQIDNMLEDSMPPHIERAIASEGGQGG